MLSLDADLSTLSVLVPGHRLSGSSTLKLQGTNLCRSGQFFLTALLLVGIGFVVAGCDHSIVPVAFALDCHRNCCHQALAFLREDGPPVKAEVNSLALPAAAGGRTDLQSELLNVAAKRLVKRAAVGYLEALTDGALEPPSVLVDRDGHFHVLHGVYSRDGARYFHLAHGQGDPELLGHGELDGLGVAEVWQRSTSGSPKTWSQFGSAVVGISPAQCNMGILTPQETASATVAITNSGESAVEIESVQTSCGCTSASLKGQSRVLLPGASTTLTVTLSGSVVPPVHEVVKVTLRESNSENRYVQDIEVFGCKFPTKKLSSRTIHLGSIRRGAVASTVFRLSEVPTDRFSISSVHAAGLPLRSEILAQDSSNGLITYRVSLDCDTSGLKPLRYQGYLTFETTSTLAPTVKVPVELHVLPAVQITPEVLNFDVTSLGKESVGHATITSQLGSKLLSVKSLNVSSDMKVSVGPAVDGEIPVEIHWTTNKSNNAKHTVMFLVSTSEGIAALKLDCSRELR